MTDPILHRARELAAAQYPEHLVDNLGREHPSIVRRGIASGQFDLGSLVRCQMAAAERDLLRSRPESEGD